MLGVTAEDPSMFRKSQLLLVVGLWHILVRKVLKHTGHDTEDNLLVEVKLESYACRQLSRPSMPHLPDLNYPFSA